MMNVGDLRQLIDGVDDAILVLIPGGDDTDYRTATMGSIETVQFIEETAEEPKPTTCLVIE